MRSISLVPCCILIATIAVTCRAAALEAPADFPALFQQQSQWKGELKGLHCRYRVKLLADSQAVRARFPKLDLFFNVVLETWIAEDGAIYRYESSIDSASMDKACEELAKAAGLARAAIPPKTFNNPYSNKILIRSRIRSEELDKDSGDLVIRRSVGRDDDKKGDYQPLHADSSVQPLFLANIGEIMTSSGMYQSGHLSNPFSPAPALTGVRFTDPQHHSQADHASLSAVVHFSEAPESESIPLAVELIQLGNDAQRRWFVEKCIYGSEIDGECMSITWKVLPKVPYVAVPERLIITARGRIMRDVTAELAESIAAMPKKTWLIDPLLAKTMFDQTAGIEIEPAGP